METKFEVVRVKRCGSEHIQHQRGSEIISHFEVRRGPQPGVAVDTD